MHPSPSLPPTGRPQSLARVYETDLPLGRKSVLLRKLEVRERFDLRVWTSGRAPALEDETGVDGESSVVAGTSPAATNSALDDAMMVRSQSRQTAAQLPSFQARLGVLRSALDAVGISRMLDSHFRDCGPEPFAFKCMCS